VRIQRNKPTELHHSYDTTGVQLSIDDDAIGDAMHFDLSYTVRTDAVR
jgi:hypothetical protein